MTATASGTVTITAAQSGGATTTTPFVFGNGAVFAARNDGSGKQMFRGGQGKATLTNLPAGAFVVKLKVAMGTTTDTYNNNQLVYITDGSKSIGMQPDGSAPALTTERGINAPSSSATFIDGAVHDFAIEFNGNNYTLYGDGTAIASYYDGAPITARTLNFEVNGAGASDDATRGTFDLRIYAGTFASLGALYGEWLLDGTGTAS